jgi:HK97 gp10 family phage protein
MKLKVTGLKELERKLSKLDLEVKQKIMRAVTNAGAQVFKKAVVARAPVAPAPYKIEGLVVQPHNIGRNVVVKRLKPHETDHSSEHLVIVRGKKKYGYASRLASLAEFGSVKQAPDPFFRPAAAEAAQAATDAAKKRFEKRVNAAIKKLQVK